MSGFGPLPIVLCATAAMAVATQYSAQAAHLALKDGRILQGKLAPVAGVMEPLKPASADGSDNLRLIWMINDELRWTFISKRQIQNVAQDDVGEVLERFGLRQPRKRAGAEISSVGPAVRTQPFDSFGRRFFTMITDRGPVDVIEAMTVITPKWIKVEGISHVRDMRMATNSVPLEILDQILRKQIDEDNPNHLRKIAGFYLQAERYEQAREELEKILEKFPDEPDLQKQLAPSIRAITQLAARRQLKELRSRYDAGQHKLVWRLLNDFPSEDVAGVILQEVREIIRQYEEYNKQGKESLEEIKKLQSEVNEQVRGEIQPVCDEIVAELSINTLGRMAAFRQLAGDESLLSEEKIALAVSGWLVGSDSAMPKLPVASSLFRVRQAVRQYLNTPDKLSRTTILQNLYSEEGATPEYVAKLIAHMKPSLETPTPPESTPGFYELEVPGLGSDQPVPYLVQLPPEYNPYRRYPTVLTLHGAGTTPALQVSWWAGDWIEGVRFGQASRHGYIVVAPKWALDHQKEYRYTAREHAAVLDVLRDACRRFSVDTDRVFLSGHSMGGDAAWDLGLAHPDLWAGVIPIVARADRYCTLYWENAKPLPYYFVCGELDTNRMVTNARDLDRYLRRGYNTTVVEYIGRGHEHFSDEIQRLFDWMGRFKRDFYPREFSVSTMRTWDNFFWWVELSGLPPRATVDPIDWPPPAGTRPLKTTAKLTATGGMNVSTGAAQATVWLSPESVNFDQRVNIVVNGKRINSSKPFIEPDLETLLEDVRLRGDRQHPFWAKLETATGRGSTRR